LLVKRNEKAAADGAGIESGCSPDGRTAPVCCQTSNSPPVGAITKFYILEHPPLKIESLQVGNPQEKRRQNG